MTVFANNMVTGNTSPQEQSPNSPSLVEVAPHGVQLDLHNDVQQHIDLVEVVQGGLDGFDYAFDLEDLQGSGLGLTLEQSSTEMANELIISHSAPPTTLDGFGEEGGSYF